MYLRQSYNVAVRDTMCLYQSYNLSVLEPQCFCVRDTMYLYQRYNVSVLAIQCLQGSLNDTHISTCCERKAKPCMCGVFVYVHMCMRTRAAQRSTSGISLSAFLGKKKDHIYSFFACDTHMRMKRTYRCGFSPSNLQGTKLWSSGFTLSSWCLQLLIHFARPPTLF